MSDHISKCLNTLVFVQTLCQDSCELYFQALDACILQVPLNQDTILPCLMFPFYTDNHIVQIYILIQFCPRTGFLRISSAYLVVFTLEWYACDQCQKAILFVEVRCHSTKTATAYKQNHKTRWRLSL